MNSAFWSGLIEAIVAFFFRHEGHDGRWGGVWVWNGTCGFVASLSLCVCDVHMLRGCFSHVFVHIVESLYFLCIPMWSTRLKGQPCCRAVKMCRSVRARLQPCLHDITNVLFWEGSVLRVRGVTTHPCWVGSADSQRLVQKYGTDMISWSRPPLSQPTLPFISVCSVLASRSITHLPHLAAEIAFA